MRYRAFTLAEVLITLGIIGVVAALSIPALMQATNDKELVSQYLKVHNTLTNAYKETEATEGYKLYKVSPEIFKLKYEEHLKTIECDEEEYNICLVDGSMYKYECDEEKCNSIIVDINGNKKPNQAGKDIYKFVVTERGLVSTGEQEICSGYDCGNYVLLHHKIFNGLVPNCNSYANGFCSGCKDGYRLNSGLCHAVEMTGCKKYSGEECEDCDNGYHNNNGQCEALETTICQSYTGDQCTDCGDSHFINGDGGCTELPMNCTAANPNGTCTTCSGNYSPSSNCTTCNGNYSASSGCTVCSGNYSLSSGCTQCNGNYSVSSGCTQCSGNYGGTNCTGCKDGFSGANCNTQNPSGCAQMTSDGCTSYDGATKLTQANTSMGTFYVTSTLGPSSLPTVKVNGRFELDESQLNCPSGTRLPTDDELTALYNTSWSGRPTDNNYYWSSTRSSGHCGNERGCYMARSFGGSRQARVSTESRNYMCITQQ